MLTGSLQIKKGKYYISLNTYVNGKRKPTSIPTGLKVEGNKKKAEKLLREKIQEYEDHPNIVLAGILFSDYVEKWLALVKMSVDVITYDGYKNVAKAHIIPYFAERGTKLNEVDREVIQTYITDKYEHGRVDGKGGLSTKTLKTHRLILHLILKEALMSGLITTDPCIGIKLPKSQRREPTFYTKEQVEELLEDTHGEPLYPVIYFTVIYGLRRSEVLGIKWDSIDFEAGTLTIKHTVVCYDKIVEKDSTKTSASYRSYPLTDDVKAILLDLRSQEEENRRLLGSAYRKNDYVFKRANGQPFTPDYVTKMFAKLLEKYDLPHIRFHDLRHSCASLLIAQGFDMKDVQEWLGHADYSTTANLYAHLNPKRKNTMAESMSNSFSF